MGNCLACFRDRHRRHSARDGYEGDSSCKYQQAAVSAGQQHQQMTTTTATGHNRLPLKDNVLHNNNYSHACPQVQSELRLTNRDVLDRTEIQGLLRPEHGSLKTATDGPPSTLKTLLKLPARQQVSDNKINALFETYRAEECEDAILAQGIERLCADLRYKPEDFAVLVLAWRLDASQMCRFTKAEFIQGLHTLDADTIEGVRQRLEEEVERLNQDRPPLISRMWSLLHN